MTSRRDFKHCSLYSFVGDCGTWNKFQGQYLVKLERHHNQISRVCIPGHILKNQNFFFFFIVHRKRIHRAHIRHNLIQATHCYVNTYHNGYTIHVLPNFLYIHIYIYTHTYIHSCIGIYMYLHIHIHIYIFKPEVFFSANENIVHKTRMQKIWFTFGLVIYIFYHIF